MAVVACIAVAKLLLHLLTASRYGLFRDELYYVACSDHLGAGYIDHPPLIAFITWLERHALGDSMIALRFLPAVAGAGLVLMTGILARELGGGRFAQGMAALAVFFVPYYLILQHWLTMNAFEPLIWTACAWCVARAINTGEGRPWLLFGFIAGVGLENKYSILFLAVGIIAGLALTRERRFLANGWLWLGVAVSMVIFAPNLVWLVRHDFPFLTLMHNVRSSGRDVSRAPISFILDQAMVHGPLLFPLWLGGLLWLLLGSQGRRYRVLGIAFLFVFAALLLLKGKNYYVSPVYAMMLAAGSVALESATASRFRPARWIYATAVAAFGLVVLPTAVPILPPATFLDYEAVLCYPLPVAEHQRTGVLPQYFADEFGWQEMVQKTSEAFHRLTPEEQGKAVVFANNYGEAAAIDFYGPALGLPKAVCGHQSYSLWKPTVAKGDVFLVLGSDGAGDREHFASVTPAGNVDFPYSRLDEHYTIWLCRNLRFDIRENWGALTKWN